MIVMPMTIKELYEWAEEQGVENYIIEIQNRDGGCIVDGTEDELILKIRNWSHRVVL